MKRFILQFSFLFSLSLSSFAIETDQFAAWTLELRDSSPQFEQYLRQHIKKTLNWANTRRRPITSCDILVSQLSAGLSQSVSPFVTSVEHWLMHDRSVDYHVIANHYWDAINGSIYNGYFPYKVVPFGATVNLYGVHLGVDKVGHFAELGMSYYERMRSAMKSGKTYDQAVKLGIEHGIFMENTLYGTLVARVFSYGDMEANYQGMRWYESLCTSGTHTHFEWLPEQKRWQLANEEKLSLKEFINPAWDESYNLNYFTPGMFSRVMPALKKYCRELGHPVVQARFKRYSDIFTGNDHLEYLESKAKKHIIPLRKYKTMQEFCSEPFHFN